MAELITMPKLGFDMAEGTLVRWVKVVGDEVNKGDVIAEIETDKATVEVESSFSGVMVKLVVDEGTTLPVNAPIAVVAEKGEEPSEEELKALVGEDESEKAKKKLKKEEKPTKEQEDSKKEVETELIEEEVDVSPAGGVRSSPLARRMAMDHDVPLQKIDGSGPRGRVIKKDIENYLEKGPELAASQGIGSTSMPAFTLGEIPADEVIEMSRLRQAIGRRMQDSNQNFPHFYITRAYKTGALLKLRKELNGLLTEEEKLSVNDFIIKGVALALRQYPNLNAAIEDDKHIRRFGHVNIGVAVAVDGGLLTIVCKDADQKPVRLIAREIRDMATRARDGKVKNEDIEGSTFSISNLGMFGVDNFAAIINPPEAGILAVSAAQEVPMVVEGEIVVGSQMKVTLSADHRVTDGAEAAEFMRVLAAYIEQPKRLLL